MQPDATTASSYRVFVLGELVSCWSTEEAAAEDLAEQQCQACHGKRTPPDELCCYIDVAPDNGRW